MRHQLRSLTDNAEYRACSSRCTLPRSEISRQLLHACKYFWSIPVMGSELSDPDYRCTRASDNHSEKIALPRSANESRVLWRSVAASPPIPTNGGHIIPHATWIRNSSSERSVNPSTRHRGPTTTRSGRVTTGRAEASGAPSKTRCLIPEHRRLVASAWASNDIPRIVGCWLPSRSRGNEMVIGLP